jgi:hypothetical protein
MSDSPIPLGDFMKTMKRLNPDLKYGPPGFNGFFS